MARNHHEKAIAMILAAAMLFCAGCGSKKGGAADVEPGDYVTLGEYKGLKVSKVDTTVSEGDITEQIMNTLESHSTTEEVTGRAVQTGDIVNIDYEGKKDGVAFDGGTGNYDLEIGSGAFIPGFEDGVIGMEIGETKDIPLTFPENYASAELAGQDLVFTFTVNSISEKVTPELTDELVKELDDDYETVDAYLAHVREELEEEKKESAQTAQRSEALQLAYDNAVSDLDNLPEELVSQNATEYTQSMESFALQYGMTMAQYLSMIGSSEEEFAERAWEYGQELAKEQLVVQAIADAEGLSVSKSEIEDYYKEYAATYGTSVDTLKENVSEDLVSQYLLMQKVRDFIYENAIIE